MKTLLFVSTESNNIYDGSVKGTSIKVEGNITTTKDQNVITINKGFIEPGPIPELEKSTSFTLEATLKPTSVLGGRQDIMEAQSPPIALFIDATGRLVGSINIKGKGWQSVKSKVPLIAMKAQHVIFSRDSTGKMVLETDGKRVGSATITGVMEPVGKQGFRIGTWVDGNSYQYKGTIGNIQIRDGAFTTMDMNKRISKAKQLEKSILTKLASKAAHVIVNPSLDESYSRLQPIKDIMNAAGVQKISDLSTLKLTAPITMTSGKVLVAGKKNTVVAINWEALSKNFHGLNSADKKSFMAKYMINRNSSNTIKASKTERQEVNPRISSDLSGSFTEHIDTLANNIGTGLIPGEIKVVNPKVEALRAGSILTDHILIDKTDLTVINKERLLEKLESRSPELWPILGTYPHLLTLQALPVNSSVIIAGTLDLTNTQVIIEPFVEKLYIIAEKVICGPNAKITWRKPGGSTPARLDNPDLNAYNWVGVHTKPNSWDGIDGDDGRAGETGINGAPGLNAPSLEMWVKNLTNIPSIDLNGEDGITGGKGQKGGRGGDGADGHLGTIRYIWNPFGDNWEWCDQQPGDGGDGGNGGRGGSGGKGGSGANGGKIIIGVLDGTLEGTVTASQFQWKNQGGKKGRGGDPGQGGYGGRGGRSGVGKNCKDAEDGHNGAQGQPGLMGADGSSVGVDGVDQFFEFTEDAWNDMLTRPWITEVVPDEVFPGNQITIRGSRFAVNDRVIIPGVAALVPVINADESLSVTIPANIKGGTKSLFVRRSYDNTESNHISVRIKPLLDLLPATLAPLATVTITGKAFLPGASVLINGSAITGIVNALGTQIVFQMIGTGGSGSSGGTVTVAVRNPDGLVSNTRSSVMPRILEIPFKFGTHDLPFSNFTDGIPSWSTYEDTFGSTEVWHEQLDPIFGHPILTAAFYGFYHYFLKGTANGGLATGFCTSLSCLVADKLWQGLTNAHTTTKASVHEMLTGVHGKLLSRESLIHFHDQSQQGVSRVELTARAIERTFLTGCDRNVAPLLFFIPSGSIWDSGYIDKLGSTHCIMPYRFTYPSTHSGPRLSADGRTTISSLDGVKLYCWDCNHPDNANCRLEFRMQAGVLNFSYFPDGALQFDSSQGITLGYWTNGDYLLADHDLPFSGPFGLTSFIVDFLLSPADLEITDESGLRVGNFNNMIFSEMPDSHPFYLVKGAYLVPVGHNLTRKIVGNGTGKYTFNSLTPDGTTIRIEDVPTKPGHRDTLIINSDASQIRFTPHEEKNFTFTFSKLVGTQMRSLAFTGVGGGPGTDVDVTVSPDLNIFRLGNRTTARNVTVKAFSIDKSTNVPVNKISTLALPNNHDLVVTVSDWNKVDLNTEVLAF